MKRVLAILILVQICRQLYALSCYTCSSLTSPRGCYPPFNPNASGVVIRKCDKTVHNNCFALTIAINSGLVTVRGCGENKCKDDNASIESDEACYTCETDNCNNDKNIPMDDYIFSNLGNSNLSFTTRDPRQNASIMSTISLPTTITSSTTTSSLTSLLTGTTSLTSEAIVTTTSGEPPVTTTASTETTTITSTTTSLTESTSTQTFITTTTSEMTATTSSIIVTLVTQTTKLTTTLEPGSHISNNSTDIYTKESINANTTASSTLETNTTRMTTKTTTLKSSTTTKATTTVKINSAKSAIQNFESKFLINIVLLSHFVINFLF